MNDWNDILAPRQHYKDCYPKVREAARAILDNQIPGELLSAGFFIKEITGAGATKATRSRCGRALRALAKREDGLMGYYTTSEGPNHFRPGETATRYLWHAYKKPEPKPVCALCGQELEETEE